MCGIAGFITSEKQKAKQERAKFMASALFLNTLRGDDSTGIFYVPASTKKNDRVGWLKHTVSGPHFIELDKYQKIIEGIDDYAIMVGHNRAATVGKVALSTAHPFQEGPITLVHNGTLDTTYGLPKGMFAINSNKKEGETKVEVDSHVICHNLSTEDREDVIRGLWGAYALVWHDTRENALFMVRNDRRPLHIAQDLDSNTVYFMSEAEMLALICRRINVNLGPIYQPEPNVLLKFEVGKTKPTIKKLEPATVAYHDPNWGLPKGGHRRPFTRGTTSTVPRPTITENNVNSLTGSSMTSAEANTVFIGGKMRQVPEAAQSLLLEAGFLVEDRYLVRPIEASPYRHDPTRCMVIGSAHGGAVKGAITCLLYDMEMSVWEARKNDLWAVRPVGIKHQDEKGYILICRPVSLHTERSRDIVWKSLRRTSRDDDDVDPVGGPVTIEMGGNAVPGPRGGLVSLEKFRDLVAGGCFHCGKPILAAHASSIQWVMDYSRPLCGRCVQDWLAQNPPK